MSIDFRFQDYLARQKAQTLAEESHDTIPRYAFQGDRDALAMLRKLTPVTLAVEATVRMGKDLWKNDLLGNAVRVSQRQFPSIHALAAECASQLGIAVPTVYIHNSPYLNAYTYGTQSDSFVVIHSALIDHLSEEELRFVIGHECGHIQNNHVVYLSAAHYLKTMASAMLRWVATPALYALNTWSRRAEITCDRAGLLLVKNLDLAQRAIIKLAVGSQKLYEQIDPEEYLTQLEDGRRGLGRLSEAGRTHPYLPKRVEALRLFSRSALFQEACGSTGGCSLMEIDEEVGRILSIA
jgi:Zn-dependent protease with chaperone function